MFTFVNIYAPFANLSSGVSSGGVVSLARTVFLIGGSDALLILLGRVEKLNFAILFEIDGRLDTI